MTRSFEKIRKQETELRLKEAAGNRSGANKDKRKDIKIVPGSLVKATLMRGSQQESEK